MSDGIKALLCRLFKVPSQPDPPPGDSDSIRVFRAGKNYFRYKLILWIVGQTVAIGAIVVAVLTILLKVRPDFPGWLVILLFLLASVVAVELVISYFVLRLDFEMRWYIVTARSLRIREGILSVREKTITFANIQNITVRQGPVQRLLGLADVEVSTAGGGGGDPHGKKGVGEDLHVGYFRGVDNAEVIRAQVEAGVRAQKGAGLGDPEDRRHVSVRDGALDAAGALLAEVRALRAAAAEGFAE